MHTGLITFTPLIPTLVFWMNAGSFIAFFVNNPCFSRYNKTMKLMDEKMIEYWNSLPPRVQRLIADSGAEISSLGMLTKLGDYYKNDPSLGEKRSGVTD